MVGAAEPTHGLGASLCPRIPPHNPTNYFTDPMASLVTVQDL